jgi:hypothetical protein
MGFDQPADGRLFELLRNAWVADDQWLNGTSRIVAIEDVPE